MRNVVVLIGNMAFDPELKYTNAGKPLCNLRLAVQRNFKNADGEREADFIDCVAWGQAAEFVANNLGKGRQVAVHGSLRVQTYEDRDGNRRKSVTVHCDSVTALDRPRLPERTVEYADDVGGDDTEELGTEWLCDYAG